MFLKLIILFLLGMIYGIQSECPPKTLISPCDCTETSVWIKYFCYLPHGNSTDFLKVKGSIAKSMKDTNSYFLELNSMTNSRLSNDILAGLTLTFFKLSQSDTSEIDKDAFKDSVNSLTMLDFYFTKLKKIPIEAISNLRKLNGLEIALSLISSIDKSDMDKLPTSITKLSFKGNNISTIDPNAFDKLVNLKTLWLNENMLTSFSNTIPPKIQVTSEFNIKKGVRQGCILSPSLFNLYTEKIFREVDDMQGIVVGGVNINNLRYADDTVLIADSAAQLQELINAVNGSGRPYGMTMNVEKTKSMVISKVLPVPIINIMLETEAIKQTLSMVYIGHMVTEDGKNSIEIKRRIAIAKDAFNNMANILTSRNLKMETKKRLVKCYIWSTLLYGAETLTKIMMTKIEAFEMWIYRRMLKISYTEHRTNEFVLRKIEAKRGWSAEITPRSANIIKEIGDNTWSTLPVNSKISLYDNDITALPKEDILESMINKKITVSFKDTLMILDVRLDPEIELPNIWDLSEKVITVIVDAFKNLPRIFFVDKKNDMVTKAEGIFKFIKNADDCCAYFQENRSSICVNNQGNAIAIQCALSPFDSIEGQKYLEIFMECKQLLSSYAKDICVAKIPSKDTKEMYSLIQRQWHQLVPEGSATNFPIAMQEAGVTLQFLKKVAPKSSATGHACLQRRAEGEAEEIISCKHQIDLDIGRSHTQEQVPGRTTLAIRTVEMNLKPL
ncbi:Leucine-rich repeat-containing G-protein coupled receptor 5 [Nymphon striatum]|nr:Leucine-rich repeat-containing G-protein coupled receptor 5 [Nymphon striatum]